ncbi:hypothetical protein B5M42_017790 [Paenibacillus athensensis]|uniref:Lipoprotein n=1 Tax=Paenibacillus athensensis TaxID=1967502 RepID=A0A4Y8Q180_9BACL|nr:hypothetical protein [Paenibacillus athensensis]MCD1260656.1 hypothetical protein [Paenibacillus athensensis]
MKAWKQAAAAGIAISLLTGCSMLKSESEQTDSDGNQSAGKHKDVKAQSANGGSGGQKASVIDQELNKQFQIYKEIIDYQLQQERKVQEQSEERYKQLKELSDKPAKSGKSGQKQQKKASTNTGSGDNKEKSGNQSDRNMGSNK